jgi:hypothetical protein
VTALKVARKAAFSRNERYRALSKAEILQDGADPDRIPPSGQAGRRAVARQMGKRMGRCMIEDANVAATRQ